MKTGFCARHTGMSSYLINSKLLGDERIDRQDANDKPRSHRRLKPVWRAGLAEEAGGCLFGGGAGGFGLGFGFIGLALQFLGFFFGGFGFLGLGVFLGRQAAGQRVARH